MSVMKELRRLAARYSLTQEWLEREILRGTLGPQATKEALHLIEVCDRSITALNRSMTELSVLTKGMN